MNEGVRLSSGEARPPTEAGLELRCILAITHRLSPRIKGAGRLAQALTQFAMRKPRPPVEADILGCRMRLDPAEFLEQVILFYPQFWDPAERAFLAEWLRPGDVFLDVGGHVGFYALAASRLVGREGLVLTIEAAPDTCRKLRANLELNDVQNVRVLQQGVSDRAETLRLSLNTAGNLAANSFLFQGDAGVEVACHPLLDTVQQQGITRIAGAKLDIEGYEYRVLSRFLADAPPELLPGFVILECNPEWIDAAGGDPVKLLANHGYRIYATHEWNSIMVREV
jgi:FkbM family methyltransferase